MAVEAAHLDTVVVRMVPPIAVEVVKLQRAASLGRRAPGDAAAIAVAGEHPLALVPVRSRASVAASVALPVLAPVALILRHGHDGVTPVQ